MPTEAKESRMADVVAGRFEEELGEDQAGGGGVDEEVVPLDGGPDNGGKRYPAVILGRSALPMGQSAHSVPYVLRPHQCGP